MFYQAALQLFVHFNKFLQREDSIICVILKELKSFLGKLLGRFVKIAIIKSSDDICSIAYDQNCNQLPGKINLQN